MDSLNIRISEAIFRPTLVVRLIRQIMVFLLLSVLCTHAIADRVALLVSSRSYAVDPIDTSLVGLQNLASKLDELSFDVIQSIDPSYFELDRLLSDFASRADGAELSLFYFEGHSISLDSNSYLVPVDVDLRSRADIRKMVQMDAVLEAVATSSTGMAAFDICWNSSLAAGWGDQFDKSPVCSAQARRIRPPVNVVASFSRSSPVGTGISGMSFATQVASSFQFGKTPRAILDNASSEYAAKSGDAGPLAVIGSGGTDSVLARLVVEAEAGQQFPNVVNQGRDADVHGNTRAIESARSDGQLQTGNQSRTVRIRSVRALKYLFNAPNSTRPVLAALSDIGNLGFYWQIDEQSNGTLSIVSRSGNRTLAGDMRSNPQKLRPTLIGQGRVGWILEEVPFGASGEITLKLADTSQFLHGRGEEVTLNSSSFSSASGWILEDASEVPLSSTRSDGVESSNALDSSGEYIFEEGVGTVGESSLVRFMVLTSPEDATVTVLGSDSRYVSGMALPAGDTVRLLVSRDGYRSLTREILLPQTDAVYKVDLPKEVGLVTGQKGFLRRWSGDGLLSEESLFRANDLFEDMSHTIERGMVADLRNKVEPGYFHDLFRHLIIAYDIVKFDKYGLWVGESENIVHTHISLGEMMLDGVSVEPMRSMQNLQLSIKLGNRGKWGLIGVRECGTSNGCGNSEASSAALED